MGLAQSKEFENLSEWGTGLLLSMECVCCLSVFSQQLPLHAFGPCGHCFCNQEHCASQSAKHCPVCSAPIETRTRCYGITYGAVSDLDHLTDGGQGIHAHGNSAAHVAHAATHPLSCGTSSRSSSKQRAPSEMDSHEVLRNRLRQEQLLRMCQVRELEGKVSRLEEQLAGLQSAEEAAAESCWCCAPSRAVDAAAASKRKDVAAAKAGAPQQRAREAAGDAHGAAGMPRERGQSRESQRQNCVSRVLALKAKAMVAMVDGLPDVRDMVVNANKSSAADWSGNHKGKQQQHKGSSKACKHFEEAAEKVQGQWVMMRWGRQRGGNVKKCKESRCDGALRQHPGADSDIGAAIHAAPHLRARFSGTFWIGWIEVHSDPYPDVETGRQMCLIWHQPQKRAPSRHTEAEMEEEARACSAGYPTSKTRHADPKHFAEIRLLGPLAAPAKSARKQGSKPAGASAGNKSERSRLALLELMLDSCAIHPDRYPLHTPCMCVCARAHARV